MITDALYGLASVGALAILWILGRFIAQAVAWHMRINVSISALQSEQKYQEDRVRIAIDRIFDMNQKVQVEFKR